MTQQLPEPTDDELDAAFDALVANAGSGSPGEIIEALMGNMTLFDGTQSGQDQPDPFGDFIRNGPTFDADGKQTYGEWGYERYVCAGGQVHVGDPKGWKVKLLNGEEFEVQSPPNWNADIVKGAVMMQTGLSIEAITSVAASDAQ